MKSFVFAVGLLLVSVSTSSGQYTPTDTFSYYSTYFGTTRRLKISLPEEYEANPDRRYRVVYLFDAQSSALYNFTVATLSFFPGYASFYFDPVIVVGIETRNRHFEFLPEHVNTLATPDNYQKAGGADTLALSIENEVKPLIDKRYRTNGFTIAIGHSLGATFVTYSMLKYPAIFNAGICVSPNYGYDDDAIVTVFKNAARSRNLSGRFLYIAHGHGDETEDKFTPSTTRFGALLDSSAIPNLSYKIDALDNTSHSTTPMEGIFKGLVFINDFMNLPYDKYKPLLQSDRSATLVEFVKESFRQRSVRTGAPLPTIGELNLIAYNAFYAKRKKEAIELLQWGISLYPDDANLYDSIGEMEEDAGEIEKAKSYYARGLSIINAQKARLSTETFVSKVKWFNKRLDKLQPK